MIRGDGLLAIWSDVTPETEVDYRHWLTREHILERVVARAGLGLGGVVSPLRCRLGTLSDPANATSLVERLAAMDGVSAVWLLAVDQDATTVQTKEKAMRKGSEGLFDAVLGIEGLAAEPVRAAARSALEGELSGLATDSISTIPIFAAAFTLDRRIAHLPLTR